MRENADKNDDDDAYGGNGGGVNGSCAHLGQPTAVLC